MKKLEFETNGQKWVILDVNYDSMTFVRILDTATAYLGSEKLFNYTESYKLSDITEIQAREVVDWNEEKGYYYKYPSLEWEGDDVTAIKSLHSLIESKGFHLFENPFKGEHPNDEYVAEDYTFYNPYLFIQS